MAKRLWDGRPYKDYAWAKPIAQVLENEKLDAMARARDLARQEAQAKETAANKAREEAVESQAQERDMLRAGRQDVLAALLLAASLVPAMQQAARAITEGLKPGPATAEFPKGAPPAITARDAMSLMVRHTQLVAKSIGAAEAIIQLSRLDRGLSTINVGAAPTVDLSLEQALEELEALEGVVEGARAKTRSLPAAPEAKPTASKRLVGRDREREPRRHVSS